MKLLFTILLGLLLVQSVVGLHLHTEGEDTGNSTKTEGADLVNITAFNNSVQDVLRQLKELNAKAYQDFSQILNKTTDEIITNAANDNFIRIADFIDFANNKWQMALETFLSPDATAEEKQNDITAANQATARAKKIFEEYNKSLEELKRQQGAKASAASP